MQYKCGAGRSHQLPSGGPSEARGQAGVALPLGHLVAPDRVVDPDRLILAACSMATQELLLRHQHRVTCDVGVA